MRVYACLCVYTNKIQNELICQPSAYFRFILSTHARTHTHRHTHTNTFSYHYFEDCEPMGLKVHIATISVNKIQQACFSKTLSWLFWTWVNHCILKLHTVVNQSVLSFWPIDREHNPRNGIWNDLICLVILLIYSCIYLKVENDETKNKKQLTWKTNERKWRPPQFQLHLVIKSCDK